LQQFKIDSDVINHLLFHKSIIDEKDDTTRINQYVTMLQKTESGEHISMENPFDRSIAIAFELVIQQHLNPWEIDLVNFSTMYLKRAKDEKIDLITAGRIIYMAWKVLKLQSDDLIISMENKTETYEPFDWSDLNSELYLTSDNAYSYTNLVMNMSEPPLDEPLRRDAKRKVTLMELLTAFDQARKESEEYQILDEQRRQERERLSDLARKRMKGTAHEDHLEEDIQAIWERIKKQHKKIMTLSEICEKQNREETIKVLMSILFLAYDNKINVYQKRFPFGKIFIENIMHKKRYIAKRSFT
jgi:segregation and condensation protein A